MKRKLEVATVLSLSSSDFSETEVEIVEQLKKMNEMTSKSENVQTHSLLTSEEWWESTTLACDKYSENGEFFTFAGHFVIFF